jgi:hypothetical protein
LLRPLLGLVRKFIRTRRLAKIMLNVLDQVAQGRKPARRTAAFFAVASARSPPMVERGLYP